MGFASRGVTLADITAAVNTSVGTALASNKPLTLDIMLYPEIDLTTITQLTTLIYQAKAYVEGTMSSAAKLLLNDGITTGASASASLNQYAIIDLGSPHLITQYNHYGQADMIADGEWTLDYLTVAGWQNWATFPTRVATWTGWQTMATVAARWLRLKCTVQDTFGTSNMLELDVKY